METQKQAHPTEQFLAAFALGKLTPESHGRMQRHLAACAQCSSFIVQTPHDTLVALMKNVTASRMSDQSTAGIRASETLMGVPSQSTGARDVSTGGWARKPENQSLGSRGTPLSDDIPQVLRDQNKYRVIRLLGRGGMGAVYEAHHERMDRQVAIKVISPEIISNPEALKRFDQEIRAAAKLDHPNVARAYDADTFGPLRALVMEFVPGQTLESFVQKNGPLTAEHACEVMEQALLGLQHAFERNMVHRDLKPQNLMISPDGKVKILDFGLAKLASECQSRTGLTRDHALMGTPGYLAPEQALDAADADIRADIYSLGCTLYYLLTGEAPFKGATDMQVLYAHQHVEPPQLQHFRGDVPHKLAEIAKWMLAKAPSARPQTPGELIRAFNSLHEGSVSRMTVHPAMPIHGVSFATAVPAQPAPAQLATPPNTEQVVPFDPRLESDRVYARRPKRTGPDAQYLVMALIAAPLIGLIVAIVGLGTVNPQLDVFGLFHKPQVAQEPPPRKVASSKPNSSREGSEWRPPPARPAIVPEPKKPEEPPPPLPPVEAQSETSTVAEFDVPNNVELPDLTGGASVKVATVSAENVTVGIHNPDGNPLAFKVSPSDDKSFWLIKSDENEVAKITRQNSDLQFTWAPNAQPETECLRNVLLTFHAWDNEKIAKLRATKTDTLSTINLDKTNAMILPLDIELWGLKASKLRFELKDVVQDTPIARFEPETRKEGANRKIRALVRDEWPFACLDISLNASGQKTSLRVEPKMAIDNKKLPWTVDSVNTIKKQLSKSIADAKREIPLLEIGIKTLSNQIGNDRAIQPRNVQYPAAQARLAENEPLLLNAQTRHAGFVEMLPVWEERSKALEKLADIGNTIHRRGKLAYRVYYAVGGQEIDVFRAE